MKPVIEAKNVSICYMVGDLKDIGLKEYVLGKLRGTYQARSFWAVNDVSFTLEKRDMLGIIGKNGAGKSTLLKAVTGIMVPTTGSLIVRGQISALLELGSGFDPELTVRQNTYLRGAMLGFTRDYMDEQYHNILTFAELEEFEGRYFRQLSSGMKSRLAFSIASMVNPDILILDEVLSVGDGAFRERSEQKMHEIMACGATTILVSHSLPQIRKMCNKVLWLERGKQIAFGPSVPLCDAYGQYLKDGKLPEPGELEQAVLAWQASNADGAGESEPLPVED